MSKIIIPRCLRLCSIILTFLFIINFYICLSVSIFSSISLLLTLLIHSVFSVILYRYILNIWMFFLSLLLIVHDSHSYSAMLHTQYHKTNSNIHINVCFKYPIHSLKCLFILHNPVYNFVLTTLNKFYYASNLNFPTFLIFIHSISSFNVIVFLLLLTVIQLFLFCSY